MSFFYDKVIKLHRDRAALNDYSSFFLINEVVNILLERLQGNFTNVLDVGCHIGNVAKNIDRYISYDQLIQCDVSENMLNVAGGKCVLIDGENIPFADNSFDLVISVFTLHAVNNLSKVLRQIYRILRPKGVFLCNLFGPRNLWQLQQAIVDCGLEGDLHKMIFPCIDIKSAGRLMQSVGFKMVSVDGDSITVEYGNINNFFRDVKNMGESNALQAMPKHLVGKKYMENLINCYKSKSAMFDLILMTGMKEV